MTDIDKGKGYSLGREVWLRICKHADVSASERAWEHAVERANTPHMMRHELLPSKAAFAACA